MQEENIQLQQLTKGQYYVIIDIKSGKVLSVENKTYKSEIQNIILENRNEVENVRQIWMVDSISPNRWEIIHFQTSFVMSAENDCRIRLRRGEQKPNQLYSLCRIEPFKYTISQIIDYTMFLCFNDSLIKKTLEFDEFHKPQWQIRPVDNNKLINSSFIIESAYSLKVLDIPQASMKEGRQIIQYSFNNRNNQRWLIQKSLTSSQQQKEYVIKSLLNQMVLDIKSGHMREGTPVLQWPQKSQPHQQWKIQYQGNDLYLITSVKDQSFVLSIDRNSFNDRAGIVISQSKDYSYWRILSKK